VRHSFSVAALAVISALSFPACGSAASTSTPTVSSSSLATSGSATEQPLDQWVTGFCTAFADYLKSGQLPSSVPGLDPQTLKQDMLVFFDSQISATQELVTKIKALGTPAVDGGSQVSATLIHALTTAEAKSRPVREEAASLPTSAYASEKEPNRLLKEFGMASRGTFLWLREFHSDPQLRAAFDSTPGCAAVTNG
jgi:hypothetical protein